MIPIQNIYTGNSAGVVVPDTPKTDRANERFYEQQYRMNAQKLLDAQARQKQFLDFTSVEPIQAIAEKHQADQAMWIDNFEKEARKVYASSLGRPSTMQLMKLQNTKLDLLKKQQALKGNQDLFLQDTGVIAKEPWRWDVDKYSKAREQFFQTGYWDRNSAMSPSAGDVSEEFAKGLANIKLNKSERQIQTKLPDGRVAYDIETTYSDSEADIRKKYREYVLGNDSLLWKVSKKFDDLLQTNPIEAKKYLDQADANNDGVTDPAERSNAIVDWGIDKWGNIDRLVGKKYGTRAGLGDSGDINISVGGGVSKGKKILFNPTINTHTGQPGLEAPQGTQKAFIVNASKLKAPEGLVITDDLPVKIKDISKDGEIEFVVDVKDPKYKAQKQYVMENGEKKKFTMEEVRGIPKEKRDRAGVGEDKVMKYYVFDYPKQYSLFGQLSDYLGEIATNMGMTEEEVVDALSKVEGNKESQENNSQTSVGLLDNIGLVKTQDVH